MLAIPTPPRQGLETNRMFQGPLWLASRSAPLLACNPSTSYAGLREQPAPFWSPWSRGRAGAGWAQLEGARAQAPAGRYAYAPRLQALAAHGVDAEKEKDKRGEQGK